MTCKYLLLAMSIAIGMSACAQRQSSLGPELQGKDLRIALREQYYPAQVLNYGQARDTLYGRIDVRSNDSLYCVYTGYAHYMNPGVDPTQAVYDGGKKTGMNCEHSWPQSMGTKEGQAKSDMHHLFPTRIDVNQARSNHPYGEVYDPSATHWYRHSSNLRQQPDTPYLNEYSELGQGFFEPREDKKGDVARALFYVYVMYYVQLDRTFFEDQAQTLLRWHEQDPADEQERRRSLLIARYQDGKANPFVLDASLAERLLED